MSCLLFSAVTVVVDHLAPLVAQVLASLRDHLDPSLGASHPYFQLLRTYLSTFLPRSELGASSMALAAGEWGGGAMADGRHPRAPKGAGAGRLD